MDWNSATKTSDNTINVPKRWLFLHYYEALSILFRVENALRIFVYVCLKNVYKDKWLDITLTSDDSNEGSINTIAKKRMAQASNYGYLGYTSTCPIMYLTSGELIRLITSESYWKHFKDYFIASQQTVKHKLDEIGIVRNTLAHFRPLKEDDIELVKQNANHVLGKIETCISELIRCQNNVPTNTKEDWYTNLKNQENEYCLVSFFQSTDEQWVKIQITYNCPIVSKELWGNNFIYYTVLNVISSAILKTHPDLAKFVTHLSENVPFITVKDDLSANFSKDIQFVLGRKILIENHEEIKTKIEKVITTISEETELIRKDNLAKGDFVEVVNINASMKENNQGTAYWSVNPYSLLCRLKEDDPPEYWGYINRFLSEFVTATSKYPWMPTSVSDVDYHF